MRPEATIDARLLAVGTEAQLFADKYDDPDVQAFMRDLWMERGFLRISNPDTESWKYRSYQDLVVDLGGEPRRVPNRVPDHIPLMEVGQCYYNAYMLSTSNPGYTYVEGFARTKYLVVQHAWVEDETGAIIDPTWANLEADAEHATYLGVRFSTSFVLRHAIKTGYTSILDGDWRLDFAALKHGFTTDKNGLVTDLEGLT